MTVSHSAIFAGCTLDGVAPEIAVKKEYAQSVDKDGTWLKKRGKYHFGLKNIKLQMIKDLCLVY
jgi:hypothetical protein